MSSKLVSIYWGVDFRDWSMIIWLQLMASYSSQWNLLMLCSWLINLMDLPPDPPMTKMKYVEAHLRPCNVHPNPTQPQKDFEYFDTYIQKIWQRKWECLNISFSEQQIWSTFKFMQTYIYDIFININHATIGPQWVGWDRVCTCGYLCRHCSKDCSKGSKSL